MGAKNVIVTGIENKKNQIEDLILEKNSKYSISNKKIFKKIMVVDVHIQHSLHIHLQIKKASKESVKFAKNYTVKSIKNAKKVGKGIANYKFFNWRFTIKELSSEIQKFTEIKNIYQNDSRMPNKFCIIKNKTKINKRHFRNFWKNCKGWNKKFIVAGDLEYGGSKHVATALYYQ